MKRVALALTVLMVVSGCRWNPTKPVKPVTPVDPPVETRLAGKQGGLEQIQSWSLEGRISIITPEDAWSGSLIWEQTGDHYIIHIVGPLGQGAIQLDGGPDHATLKGAEQQEVSAEDPESLMVQTLGWKVPVAGLRYWVRGLAAPGPVKDFKYDEMGRPATLFQAGWEIRFTGFQQIHGKSLPAKLLLENERFKIKILIKSWSRVA